MTDWTLLVMDTPLNGGAQRAELTMAASRSMKFSLLGPAELSFTLPGRHWQTELVEPLLSDILVYRDDYCIQRFRVLSGDWSKQGGELTASFTCQSYAALLDAFIFHEDDTRSFTAVEQTAIAWTIINEGQLRTQGDLGMSRGTMPGSDVIRTLDGDWAGAEPDPHYFEVGKKKGEAVRDIAGMIDGFEWDIEPDRTSAATALTDLKFNVWNEGARKQYTPRCPFILDDGGNVSGWKKQDAPSEYANVIFAKGQYPTGAPSGADPPPDIWEPNDEDPGGAATEGRWERAVPLSAMSQQGLEDQAEGELDRRLAYQPSWSVDIAPGRWTGPEEMWVGDYCRLAILDGPIDVDADVRVVEMAITVDDEDSEAIALQLDRPARTYDEFRTDLERRLLRLEMR